MCLVPLLAPREATRASLLFKIHASSAETVSPVGPKAASRKLHTNEYQYK